MEEELEYFAAIAEEDQKQSTKYSHLIEDGLKKEEEIKLKRKTQQNQRPFSPLDPIHAPRMCRIIAICGSGICLA